MRPLHAILRNNGQSGDLVSASTPKGFEISLHHLGTGRNDAAPQRRRDRDSKAIDGISSDPKIAALKIGGPGSGGSPRFHGDVAELRVYNRPLTEAERKQVEAELRDAWFQPDDPKKPTRDPLAELYAELLSPRGPFWPPPAERTKRLAPEVQKRLEALRAELDALRNKPPTEIPQAVVAQDGGPKGTRHEGFKDAQVFIRGDHKRLGKTVPRGFPKVLTGERAGEDHRGERPASTGRLAGPTREPADGPRDGEPDLAAPLRRGAGPHAQRLRRARRAADAPRVARLPGRAVRRIGVVGEGDAPAHHALGRPISRAAAPTPPTAGPRPGQPPASGG